MTDHKLTFIRSITRWRLPLLVALLLVGVISVLAPVLLRQWSDLAWMMEYQQRLQRVLEQPLPVVEVAQPPSWPGSRALLLPLADAGTINLIELLGIRECELAEALGRHNSSLGKVAGSSEQWRQAAEFIRLAPACIHQLQASDPALAGRLQQALEIKQQQRLQYWWNAWIAGPEWQAAASLAVPVISREEARRGHLAVTLATLDQALGQQQQWLQGQWHDDGSLNDQLQALREGESIGRWLVTQAALIRSLVQINRLLAEQGEQVCPRGQKTPQGEILHNVLLKFYVAQLQPYLSANDRFGSVLLERLQQVWPGPGQPPQAWSDWLAGLQQARQQMLAASREHVQRMSAILGRCQLVPAASD
ncbi:DUF3080 family protein [Parathalassolituus penaei]|uniref:DUF3080 family protein n=1 Tax=Parathalassolituus penaei TaxID=2997323 RepID=A0A9X3EN80_9GAMM|nr:DUF3080 family protein [Parathalassolituus penaei]MCY0965773.1 DUF3080 family protein [Parathalassolituus penaei]